MMSGKTGMQTFGYYFEGKKTHSALRQTDYSYLGPLDKKSLPSNLS